MLCTPGSGRPDRVLIPVSVGGGNSLEILEERATLGEKLYVAAFCALHHDVSMAASVRKEGHRSEEILLQFCFASQASCFHRNPPTITGWEILERSAV